jgi:O-antigen/teichoic acid export membrane protein
MERYGVLSILWLLFGYFGFFDFGIGRAVAHRIAGLATEDAGSKRDVLWAGLIINLFLAAVGALFLYFILGHVLTYWINIDAELQEEVHASVFWVSLSLIPSIAGSALNGVVLGSQRFLLLNVVDVSGKLLLQALPLAAAYFLSPDLERVTQAVLVARILAFLFWAVACSNTLRGSMQPRWRPEIASTLWKYGGWITLGMLLAPLLSGVERLAIGYLRDASFVTLYAVPFSLIAPVALLSASLSNALFPRFSAVGKLDGQQLAMNAELAVTIFVTPVLVAVAFLVYPFTIVWIDAEFARNTVGVAPLLIVGFWANSLAKVFHTRLQGEGKPKVIVGVHLVELIPFLVVLYLMTLHWGILGAALAWSIRSVADMLLLGNRSGAWAFPRGYVLSGFGLVATAVVTSSMLAFDMPLYVLTGVFLFLLSLHWSWRLGLKDYVLALMPRAMQK